MSTITLIDLSLPNDGDGDKLRDGGSKINTNFTNLNADKLEKGGYTGTAQDIVNLIGAGVSPVQNDYANIAAMLADQANQTEDFLQFVVDATADPNFDPVGDEIYAFYRYLGTTNSSLIDYTLLSPAEASEVIVTSNYRQFEVKVVDDTISDTTEVGQILVRTNTGEIDAILFDPSFSKYLRGYKSLLDDENREFYIKAFNKTTSDNKLYVAKVSSIEYSDVAETCFLVEVGSNLTAGELAVTDIVEVYFDLDFTGTATIPNEEEIVGTALYNATTTGAVDIPCSTFVSWNRILTGNTTFTFTETPESGKSFTRFMNVKSSTAETLAFANADYIVGEYINDGNPNFITIELSNYPTAGLEITVFINQE